MRIEFTTGLTATDEQARTISGRIVTWGEVGNTSQGPAQFSKDSITLSDDVVLRLEHDRTRPIGKAVALSLHDDGMDGEFKISRTRAGDDALIEAADGLRAGLSIGANVISFDEADGGIVITAAEVEEVSLVTHPALPSSRVAQVAASESDPETVVDEPEGEEAVDESTTEEQAVAEVTASLPAVPEQHVEFSSLADYVNTYIAGVRGDSKAMQRVSAAVAQDKTTDVPGIIPAPIVGPIIDTELGIRPVVNASSRRTLPQAGTKFTRPLVSQHTAVGLQSAELAEIASQTYKVTSLEVAKKTYGGAVEVSFQNRDWTDPAVLPLIVTDLAKQYAIQTDKDACATLEAGATATETLGSNDAAGLMTGLYNAGAAVFDGCGEMPDTLFAAPDQWAWLGALTDTTGRPMFPTLGPVNAGGTARVTSFAMNPLGLNLVVDGNLTEGTMIVGKASYLETYEQQKGTVSQVSPSTLGFTMALYGYWASVVTVAEAFVTVTAAATRAATK